MNFQVPQFIEIEDKIFGPLTFKQFIYIAGSAGLAFICYAFLPLFIAFIPILIIVAFGLALAFYQVNERPFIFTIESFLRYLFASKLYIWKKLVVNLCVSVILKKIYLVQMITVTTMNMKINLCLSFLQM